MNNFNSIFLVCAIVLSISGCNSDNKDTGQDETGESKNEIIKSNGTKIESYNKILQALNKGEKFLVEFDLRKDYTPKQLKLAHQGLGVYHDVYMRNFDTGILQENGDIKFSGITKWNISGIVYQHNYNYTFQPSGYVLINGTDSLIKAPIQPNTNIQIQNSDRNYHLQGKLNESITVYSYH